MCVVNHLQTKTLFVVHVHPFFLLSLQDAHQAVIQDHSSRYSSRYDGRNFLSVLVGWAISKIRVRWCPSEGELLQSNDSKSLFIARYNVSQEISPSLPIPSHYQVLQDLTLELVLAASVSSSSLRQANIPTMRRMGEVAATTFAPAQK